MPTINQNWLAQIDVPEWGWMPFCQAGSSNPGTVSAYDGSRFIYWAVQTGSSSTASTTTLWRYDTLTHGWQWLVNLTSTFAGLDIEWDARNGVLWIVEGNNTSVWRYYVPPETVGNKLLSGATTAPGALSSALAPALPTTASTGSNLCLVDEYELADDAPIEETRTLGVVASSGVNAFTIVEASPTAEFQGGLIGSYVRFLTGAHAGLSRCITAITNRNTLVTSSFPSAPAAGDTFVVEVPGGTPGKGRAALSVSSATSTTLVGGAGWPTNFYRDADVVIVSGTGIGQRRRIESNDATTLTIAAATAGNARTGAWTTTPDNTSTFRIVPSGDYIYVQLSGNASALSRADLGATTPAWATAGTFPASPGGGSNLLPSPRWAPFSIVAVRGGGTAVVYRFDIGLRTWATLPSVWGIETLNTGGATSRVPGRARILVHIQGTLRVYSYSPITGVLTPYPQLPYANPAGYDGKRLRVIRVNGVEIVHFLRASGQEFFRLVNGWQA
jgi:hypothetical protein